MRIKRKATEPPLSALVISDALGGSSTGYSTPKKRRDISGRARGVFRLADTVPDSWQGKGQEGEVLKERIEALMKRRREQGEEALSTGEKEELANSMIADSSGDGPADGGGAGREVKGNRRLDESVESLPGASRGEDTLGAVEGADTVNRPGPSTPPKRKESGSGPTQYRVVPPPRAPKSNGLPPRLLNHKDLEEAARSHFRFVDAQAVNDQKPSQTSTKAPAEEDPQMAAFQSMLSEYLKLEEASKKDEDEYVYDLYYRDLRELGTGNGADIGALLGFDDLSPPSSPSDSEPEDEADEDSNDEDYYRNDYPEDEDADSDMEGYEDAFASDDDREWNSDGGSDREPGNWDYR